MQENQGDKGVSNLGPWPLLNSCKDSSYPYIADGRHKILGRRMKISITRPKPRMVVTYEKKTKKRKKKKEKIKKGRASRYTNPVPTYAMPSHR